ncbi:MAG: hypothetical protein Kow0063_15150 [Anaerolineae bacterium]
MPEGVLDFGAVGVEIPVLLALLERRGPHSGALYPQAEVHPKQVEKSKRDLTRMPERYIIACCDWEVSVVDFV